MRKYALAIFTVTMLIVIGCGGGGGSSDSDSTNSVTSVTEHNQGEACLNCHNGVDQEEFTSGGTVYTALNSYDSYAEGYTIRLELENNNTKIDFVEGKGVGNSHVKYSDSINNYTDNNYTAHVLDSDGNPVNSSGVYSHDENRLNCNSCHTATGSGGAPGRITIDINAIETVSVSSVSSDTEAEETDLVHTVDMSGASAVDETYSFLLEDGTTNSNDYSDVTFSDGVVNNGDGTITVPTGVATFRVTVTTIDDDLDEPDTETYDLSVGGVVANGNILDNDTASVSTVSDASAEEGTDLVHTVVMSGASSTSKNYPYSLTNDTTDSADYLSAEFNASVVNNGVGTIAVPAGVVIFTVTVPTIDDALDEPDTERYNLSVGGVDATGTIIDNEVPDTTAVSTVSDASVEEGTDIVHTVVLDGVPTSDKIYAFSLTDETTDSVNDYSTTLAFSDGVTINGTTISVPTGVATFTVTVPTIDDDLDEPDTETYNLSVGGVDATGTIIDNDTASVSTVSDASGEEGSDLVHTVVMSVASATDKTYPFFLTDTTTVAEDHGSATFSDGVTYDADVDEITVPLLVATFTVTVPTIDDALDEPDTETYDLSVGGVVADGNISDNDIAVLFSTDVMPILESNCKSCHGSGGSFTITTDSATYDNIIGYSFIDTADPESSLLLRKGNGEVSHKGGDQLINTEYTTIKDWISQGGVEN